MRVCTDAGETRERGRGKRTKKWKKTANRNSKNAVPVGRFVPINVFFDLFPTTYERLSVAVAVTGRNVFYYYFFARFVRPVARYIPGARYHISQRGDRLIKITYKKKPELGARYIIIVRCVWVARCVLCIAFKLIALNARIPAMNKHRFRLSVGIESRRSRRIRPRNFYITENRLFHALSLNPSRRCGRKKIKYA